MNRQQAIAQAAVARDGKRTLTADGHEITHNSISLAKLYTRTRHGVGRCVAGDDAMHGMRAQIAAREAAKEAERKAAEEAEKAQQETVAA